MMTALLFRFALVKVLGDGRHRLYSVSMMWIGVHGR